MSTVLDGVIGELTALREKMQGQDDPETFARRIIAVVNRALKSECKNPITDYDALSAIQSDLVRMISVDRAGGVNQDIRPAYLT